ncbi:hypothetical protein HDU96_007177 [Phlyctochytrium bullatum]|nr:hypothetical protein HDU96_007177 [Phlyctochytrium bullatum]
MSAAPPSSSLPASASPLALASSSSSSSSNDSGKSKASMKKQVSFSSKLHREISDPAVMDSKKAFAASSDQPPDFSQNDSKTAIKKKLNPSPNDPIAEEDVAETVMDSKPLDDSVLPHPPPILKEYSLTPSIMVESVIPSIIAPEGDVPFTTPYKYAHFERERSRSPSNNVDSFPGSYPHAVHERSRTPSNESVYEHAHMELEPELYEHAHMEIEPELDRMEIEGSYDGPSPVISALPSRSPTIPSTPKNSSLSETSTVRAARAEESIPPVMATDQQEATTMRRRKPVQAIEEDGGVYFFDSREATALPPSPPRNLRDSAISFDPFPDSISSQIPVRSPTDSGPRPVVLITGCSLGGIGYHLMLAMARRGCRVFGTVRTPAHVAELSAFLIHGDFDLGTGPRAGTIELLPMDVTDRDMVKEGVMAVMMRAGRIDVLVNNAGVAVGGGVAEANLDACRLVMETNVVVPHMVKRRSGKIVNMGSMLAYVSLPWSGIYCASKSAVRAITSSLRMELIPHNVQVSLVCAGTVRTNLIDNMERLMRTYPPRSACPTPTVFHGLPNSAPRATVTVPLTTDDSITTLDTTPVLPAMAASREPRPKTYPYQPPMQIPRVDAPAPVVHGGQGRNGATSSIPPQPPPPPSARRSSFLLPQKRSGTDPEVFADTVAVSILLPVVPASIMAGKWWWVILIFLCFPENIIEYILAWRYGLQPPPTPPEAATTKPRSGDASKKTRKSFPSSSSLSSSSSSSGPSTTRSIPPYAPRLSSTTTTATTTTTTTTAPKPRAPTKTSSSVTDAWAVPRTTTRTVKPTRTSSSTTAGASIPAPVGARASTVFDSTRPSWPSSSAATAADPPPPPPHPHERAPSAAGSAASMAPSAAGTTSDASRTGDPFASYAPYPSSASGGRPSWATYVADGAAAAGGKKRQAAAGNNGTVYFYTPLPPEMAEAAKRASQGAAAAAVEEEEAPVEGKARRRKTLDFSGLLTKKKVVG